MNESARKVLALVLCVLSVAGAIASMDSAAAHGGMWTYNMLALGALSAVFLVVALMDGAESASRTTTITNEVHVHGPGHGQGYQPQPVYNPHPPAQPQIIMMPSPQPSAPTYVMLTPEMLAHMHAQNHGHALPPAQFMGQLTHAPDGRFIAAPAPQLSLPAPREQPARQGLLRRLVS